MRVYVAGSWLERTAVQHVQSHVRNAGHTITHDWTVGPDVYTEGVGRETKTRAAISDLIGVYDAQALIWLNDAKCFAACTEFGMAIAWNRPLCVINPAARANAFFALPQVEKVGTIEEAIQWLNRLEEPR